MANEVLLSNLQHFGGVTRTYKQAAIQYTDYIDGWLFYPQLASKVGHEGDYKALLQLLNLWADEMVRNSVPPQKTKPVVFDLNCSTIFTPSIIWTCVY